MTLAASSSSTPTPGAEPLSVVALAAVLAAWLMVAIGMSAAGVFGFERPYLIPLFLFGTCAALVGAYKASPGFRARLDRIDLRLFVGFHIVRAPIGASFLVLLSRGELPELFAFRAGWGDIVAGVLALGVIPLIPAGGAAWKRRSVLFFNVVGLLDILMVVVTAQYLFLIVHDPLMLALASLPFGLLPTFVVPLVIATHLYVFARLRADATPS